MQNETCDFLIIGGGIIGLCVARELMSRYPGYRVVLLEKEPEVGRHASGRNSGVLHAGFYYSHDSLKATFCREGNQEMQNLCRENGLALNPCGKIVAARNAAEYRTLQELSTRGKMNGVELEWLDQKDLDSVDVNIYTFEKALYSPNTASINPRQICEYLKISVLDRGLDMRLGEVFRKLVNNTVVTNRNRYDCGFVVNCAGAYADKVAKIFGFSKNKVLLPFRGRYMVWNRTRGGAGPVGINLYPVPDMNFPFLGVHFTVTADGSLKIGPTASPAFWRENYLGLSRFKLRELLEILSWQASLFIKNSFGFRRLAWEEMRKWSPEYLLRQGASLLRKPTLEGFDCYGPSGIRAQLLDTKKTKVGR